MLLASSAEADLERIDNIFELVTLAKEKEAGMDLAAFLEHISLVSDLDNLNDLAPSGLVSSGVEGKEDAVTLMTIHSAKGLEFPVVFIAGMEEGLLPHFRSLYNPAELEEERRLCYVAITRAEQKLYLSAAKLRTQAGETRYNERSRFLAEIPAEYLDMQEEDAELFASRFPEFSERIISPVKIQQNIPEYNAGEAVFHNKWGKGKVLKVFGSGAEQALDIQFLRVRKTILVKYAQMEKA
jgi:DNA helicase-2/ATP-dependent DNA helicase PcrA